MAAKKPKPKKPKNYANLSQKQKFIAAARAAVSDETGETFQSAFDKIIPPRKKIIS
jgi:hypothetical protein